MRRLFFSKQFDVTGKVPGLSGPLAVAAWIFPAQGDTRGVWFCLPGGSYTKAYYHLEIPEYPQESYSFAAFMARQGYLVVALDNLGTGESTHEQQGETLFSSEMIVAANNEVLRQMNFDLMAGTLHPDLPAFSHPLPVFGLGHSWGGKLLLTQEAHHCFDAIGILGWSNRSISLAGSEARLAQAAGVPQLKSVEETVRQAASHFTPQESREFVIPFFFAPDVPRKVIEVDTKRATTLPDGVLQEDPDPTLMLPVTAKIHVPVFLCLSSLVDVSTDLKSEEATYPQGLVFSYALPDSHHCHNFASTRELLWTLLADWANGILKHYQS